MLQHGLYVPHVPTYLNLASLGLTLAHETLHSLDQTGRDFDQDGNIHHWWDSGSERAYSNVSKCLIDQYSNYFQRPLRIDARSIQVKVWIEEGVL